MRNHVVTSPRARVPHRCDLCGRTIRPGETYRRCAVFDEGTAWTWRECAHCDSVREIALVEVYGSEYGEGLIAQWEPREIHHLRLKAMWRRKWIRHDGSLYPVPAKVRYAAPDGLGYQLDARAAAEIASDGAA